jgi:myosin-18
MLSNNIVIIFSVEKLSAIATIMESFGSARTTQNVSATRMTTLFSLDVDQSGQIASANIQVSILFF